MRKMRGPLLSLALMVALAACGRSGSLSPSATEDAALSSCRADVAHANLNVHDVTALDFAIHDCASLAMLTQVVDAAPGYLNVDVTVKQFATNRCMDPEFPDITEAKVCIELGLH